MPISASTAVAHEAGALTTIGRAMLVFGLVGMSVGFALGILLIDGSLDQYLTENVIGGRMRRLLLGTEVGIAVGSGALVAVLAWLGRRNPETPALLQHAAYRVAPLGVVGFLPLLFRWRVWEGRDLTFLTLTAVAIFCFSAGLRLAATPGPFSWRNLWWQAGSPFGTRLTRWPHWPRVPFFLVCAGALGYAGYFAYYTCAWHWGVHSGWDLAIENNVLWNLIHGGPFMKSSPVFGPVGSHFGYHANLIAFAIAPIYALAQRPETLLVLQAVLIGAAAIPLYLFARLHVSAGLACLVAFVYLFYPAVHGPNIYEFRYLPLGPFFLWLTLYALEARRNGLAIVATILTLSVREDFSVGLAIFGAYLVLSGLRPRAGLVLAAVGTIYFITMKLIVMPQFAGGETFTFMFAGLLPAGDASFGGVLKTLVGNPAFTLGTLLEPAKLVYMLQILVPLAFIPMRHPLAPLFVLHGFVFTLISTGYSPTISIHYQYPAYWTIYLFIALVLVLAKLEGIKRPAAVGGLVLGLLACSYQYGSLLQTNTSFGGPIKYKFGINDEDRRRRRSIDDVVKHLPPNAKVSSSAFAIPQVSSRADSYTLTMGVYDAEYVLFSTNPAENVGDERRTVTNLLSSGTFGIVAVSSPFALARRGHATAGNAAFLADWR